MNRSKIHLGPQDRERDPAAVSSVTVLPEVDALPCSKVGTSVCDGNLQG